MQRQRKRLAALKAAERRSNGQSVLDLVNREAAPAPAPLPLAGPEPLPKQKRSRLEDYHVSACADRVLSKISAGKMSASDAKKWCVDVVQSYSVPKNDLIAGIATLGGGSRSKETSHVHRDLRTSGVSHSNVCQRFRFSWVVLARVW